MRALLRSALLLVFLALAGRGALRAYTVGAGCPDWPACYGRIGLAADPGALAPAALLALEVALALLVSAFAVASFRRLRLAKPATALLLLTWAWVVLEWRAPAVDPGWLELVRGLMGFTVLGWLGWLVFRLEPSAPLYSDTRTSIVRPWLFAALAILGVQLATGLLASANFTATVCPGPAGPCAEGWWPDATLLGALLPQRAAGDPLSAEFIRVSVARAHRLGALATGVAVLLVAGLALLNLHFMRGTAWFLLAVAVIQMTLGLALGWIKLPAGMAANHRALSALLLLGLLRLLAQSRSRYHPLD